MNIFNKSKKSKEINLLELKPIRNLKWETGDKNETILLVPKFKNRYLLKWLVPRLKKQNFKVKLDEFGSFVWNHCDGNNTVGEIAEKMKIKFGEDFDPTCERIGKFVSQMIRDSFVIMKS
jgi:hypothetical protein